MEDFRLLQFRSYRSSFPMTSVKVASYKISQADMKHNHSDDQTTQTPANVVGLYKNS